MNNKGKIRKKIKKQSGEAADVFRFLLSQKEVGCGAKPREVKKPNPQRSGEAKLRMFAHC